MPPQVPGAVPSDLGRFPSRFGLFWGRPGVSPARRPEFPDKKKVQKKWAFSAAAAADPQRVRHASRCKAASRAPIRRRRLGRGLPISALFFVFPRHIFSGVFLFYTDFSSFALGGFCGATWAPTLKF